MSENIQVSAEILMSLATKADINRLIEVIERLEDDRKKKELETDKRLDMLEKIEKPSKICIPYFEEMAKRVFVELEKEKVEEKRQNIKDKMTFWKRLLDIIKTIASIITVFVIPLLTYLFIQFFQK